MRPGPDASDARQGGRQPDCAVAIGGLHGMLGYDVARRTREIGIRVSLGARATEVVGRVVRPGLMLVLIGLVIGWAAALVMSCGLTSLWYGVTPADP